MYRDTGKLILPNIATVWLGLGVQTTKKVSMILKKCLIALTNSAWRKIIIKSRSKLPRAVG